MLLRTRLWLESVETRLAPWSSTIESIAFLLGTVLKLHEVVELPAALKGGATNWLPWFPEVTVVVRTFAYIISRFSIFIWDYSSRFWVRSSAFSSWSSLILLTLRTESYIFLLICVHSPFLTCIVEHIFEIIPWMSYADLSIIACFFCKFYNSLSFYWALVLISLNMTLNSSGK